MKRKILSMILAAIMIFSLFAMSACGDKGDDGTDTSDNAGTGDTSGNDSDSDTDAESGGDTEPAETTDPNVYVPSADNKYTGGVGVGTWEVNAYFDDLKVIDNKNRKVLYENKFDDDAVLSEFSYNKGSGGSWDKTKTSDWKITAIEDNKVLEFADASVTGAIATLGNPEWGNYTVSVKGKVVSGKEGLMLYFAVKDEKNYYYFNIGGWGNTVMCVQQCVDGTTSVITDQIPVTINYDQWYTISVTVGASVITGYLDDQQIFQIGGTPPEAINVGQVGMSTWSTEVYFDNVKVTDFKTGKVLYENTFDDPADLDKFKYDFTYSNGTSKKTKETWEIVDGKLHSTNSSLTGVCVAMGPENMTNYVYEMEGMPVKGIEGFTIIGAIAASDTITVYNIGGWNNTKACYQIVDEGAATTSDQVDIKLEYDVWHKAKLVVLDYAIFAYVDGQFTQSWWK